MDQATSGVAKLGDVEIAYDVRGTGAPLLLISGFGMTRGMWSDELCGVLAARGFQVVRMDNRDTGASTRLKKLGAPNVPRAFLRSLLGRPIQPPYRLEDMAGDALGVMSSLGHSRFHVVGASMGGMIAQTLALDHPASVLSLTSIMSTPGGRRYSFARLGTLRDILRRAPREPAAQVEHYLRVFRAIAGDGLPFQEDRARRVAEELVASKPDPAGSARQFVAILDSSGRRRQRLGGLRLPTLVVHGTHDPLLPVRGARAMARIVPHAHLLVIQGMGHWIPSKQYEQVAGAIAHHALG
jgi:pimeloyl-ACP methyl ester carboxylesterase